MGVLVGSLAKKPNKKIPTKKKTTVYTEILSASMNPNQLIRDSTYPMKSITPMKKAKVLQTFGNSKKFSKTRKLKKLINAREID